MIWRNILKCVAVAGAVMPAAAHAEARDCSQLTTQVDMNFCAADNLTQAAVVLQQSWAEVKAAYEDDDTIWPLLEDGQNKWIAYRDAACEAEAGMFAGGSIQGMIRVNCLRRLVERRTDDLNNLL